MHASDAIPNYLSDVQVAARLGIPAPQLRRWAKRGTIPGLILPDGSVLFDPAELMAWLQSRSRHGTFCTPREVDLV